MNDGLNKLVRLRRLRGATHGAIMLKGTRTHRDRKNDYNRQKFKRENQ